ncbi:hypothetical protein [Sandaracinus amylolyticus]|uniref:Uncharacterized protein n=1 Tax=Sandaracinus amylolyticus TaxID=927083 RepID=A0A0F6W6W2_9BACT|nr:hypothetical protein [Sandaracinus amylolyticus]AKF09025.1 hypothetical protein DB32_006174 [Sandaracinus amylolyticus]
MERALGPLDLRTNRATLIGAEPGALLAGATILLALHERGVPMHLAIACDDPLAAPLAKALADRGLPSEITRADTLDGAIVIGGARLLDDARAASAARIALVGLGAEACEGIDPARTHARLAALLAEGALVDRTPLFPLDALCRTWLELVEDVHHALGPAAQRPIVDAIRAALFGRCGSIAVNLAARERPAQVSLETATIVWIDPSRARR